MVPADNANTNPEELPMVATEVLELDHKPPAGVELNVPVLPTHIDEGPEIAPGSGLTVAVTDFKQPLALV